MGLGAPIGHRLVDEGGRGDGGAVADRDVAEHLVRVRVGVRVGVRVRVRVRVGVRGRGRVRGRVRHRALGQG